MAVVDSVTAEIKKYSKKVQKSVLAASAVALAEQLDDAPSRDAASIARELRQTMSALDELARKAPEEASRIDDLAARRADRREKAQASQRAAGGEQRRSGSGGSGEGGGA